MDAEQEQQEQEVDEQMSAEQFAHAWMQNFVHLLACSPFFTDDGSLSLTFGAGSELYVVNASRKPNNIIPFPKTEKAPQKKV